LSLRDKLPLYWRSGCEYDTVRKPQWHSLTNTFETLAGRSNRMRPVFSVVAAIVFVSSGFIAGELAIGADDYTFDLVHSSVSFKARHLDISWIHGRFNEVEGKFSLDRKDPAKSTFELTIKADSVDTGNKARDEHLRQPDYFDTKQFPTITFKSTSVKAIEGGYELTGDFSMHGKTKKITFPVKGGKEIEFKGTKRAGFSTELSLKRSDFGFDKSAIGPIGDEALIMIDFEGTRK
jgi:polyisoprenoid-binding protein YceI